MRLRAAAFRTEQMEIVNAGGNVNVNDEMARVDAYGENRPISNIVYVRAKQKLSAGKLPALAEATVICTCKGKHIPMQVLLF